LVAQEANGIGNSSVKSKPDSTNAPQFRSIDSYPLLTELPVPPQICRE
jgi:hypothetical protein